MDPVLPQERRLNAFHLRCPGRILGITWHDRVPNKNVLAPAKILSMFALLAQRRLRWLGHVSCMKKFLLNLKITKIHVTLRIVEKVFCLKSQKGEACTVPDHGDSKWFHFF